MARRLLRRWLPDPRSVRASRALRWLGPLLDRPWLWRVERRGIALGLAAGMFFGLLLPFAQALFAGVVALALRANLPAAVLATFVSNPITTPGIVFGAYHLGAHVLGLPAAAPLAGSGEASLVERVTALGEPVLAGLLVLATAGAALAYFGIQLAWRMASLARLARWRRRG
jgi:hypothetical protein